MVYGLILAVHILVCIFLIFIVLIQSGKGAELGAAFGGSSQTLFGARGAATIFSKLTTISAIVFMITSLSLAVMTTKGTSVVQKTPATATDPKKALPPQGLPTIPGPGAPVQPGQQSAPVAPAPAK